MTKTHPRKRQTCRYTPVSFLLYFVQYFQPLLVTKNSAIIMLCIFLITADSSLFAFSLKLPVPEANIGFSINVVGHADVVSHGATSHVPCNLFECMCRSDCVGCPISRMTKDHGGFQTSPYMPLQEPISNVSCRLGFFELVECQDKLQVALNTFGHKGVTFDGLLQCLVADEQPSSVLCREIQEIEEDDGEIDVQRFESTIGSGLTLRTYLWHNMLATIHPNDSCRSLLV